MKTRWPNISGEKNKKKLREYLTDIHFWCIFTSSNNKTKIKDNEKASNNLRPSPHPF